MKKLLKTFVASFIFIFLVNVYATNDIQEADKIICSTKYKEYNKAAEIYWKCAAEGSDEVAIDAVRKLDALYNQHSSIFEDNRRLVQGKIEWALKQYKKKHFDKTIPKKYIQKVANKFYPKNAAKEESVDIIVIASEENIIKKAIENLQTTCAKQGLRLEEDSVFSGKRCKYAGNAINTLKKDIIIEGKKGKFLTRSRKFNNTAVIALVDKETAFEQFDFSYSNKLIEWGVYVRSRTNKNVLIPFDDFHRYTYEEKMSVFKRIMEKLGAKEIRVYREENTAENVTVKLEASGKVANYGAARTETQIGMIEKVSTGTGIFCKFDKPFLVVRKNFNDPWLDREPTWKGVYDSRMQNGLNPGTTFEKIQFNYSENFAIHAKTATACKGAGWVVAVKAEGEYERFIEIIWIMEVEFYPWDMKALKI